MNANTRRLCTLMLCWFACIFMIAPAAAQDESSHTPEFPAVEIPDTAAGRQLQWILRVINDETPLGEPTERFNDRFLEDFKPGELASELRSVRVDGLEGKSAEVVSIDQNDSEESLTVTIRGRDTRRFLSVFLALDSKLQKISGLVINIAMGDDGESQWDAFDGELGGAKGTASFAAYEILQVKGPEGAVRCRLSPVHAFGEDEVLPIASAFKLWVLGAVMQAIETRHMTWDTRIPIADSMRSLPSGSVHNDPPGMSHSVRALTHAMISHSDNTATDHLIRAVGRERVESFMREVTRHPEMNRPLLTTREMFTLKVPLQPWVRDEFVEADVDARRAMVAPGGRLFRASPDRWLVRYWKRPVLVQDVEWFATCSDLCRAMMRIHELALSKELAFARDSLANGGAIADRSRWTSIGFKGGSEPGVLSFCYLLIRDDGRTFVMAAIHADEKEALDAAPFDELARRGARLLEMFE